MAWNVDVAFRDSELHGMGVFAKEAIPRGTKIWNYDETMHLETKKSMGRLDGKVISYALKAGYLHEPSGKFLWYTDGMQYMNHASGRQANVGLHYWPDLEDDHIIALRDIAPGEELREDYAGCLTGGLGPQHWLKPLYLAFGRDHYEFLLGLGLSPTIPAAPLCESRRVGRNSRTVAINASSSIGFEMTALNPEAKQAA